MKISRETILVFVSVIFCIGCAIYICGFTLLSPFPKVRLRYVAELTDQTMLIRVVINDTNKQVRCLAVGKITDQSVLAMLATTDKDWNVRYGAVDRLTDLVALGRVAVSEPVNVTRMRAIDKLKDQAVLEKIEADDKDVSVHSTVIRRLNVLHGRTPEGEEKPEEAATRP